MEQAVSFIHSLSLHIIVTNIRSSQSNDTGLRHQHIPIFEAFLNAIPHALTHTVDENAKRSQDLMTDIIRALVSMRGQDGITPSDILATLTKFGHVFTAMCLDELWTRKNAGWRGIRIMTSVPDLGIKWLMENEPELVRTLLHVLKDLAYELPRDEEEVTDVLIRVLRVGNDELKSHTPSDPGHARSRLSHLIGVFCLALSSAHPAVRRATQTCIGLLLQASGEAAPELLGPHRDRTLAAIYTKPLRALAFPLQIGMMEAVRYCISLDPPLLEVNDELLRLLHETLALADADDLTGFAQRGGNPRQNALDIIKLRVACIKLLTASMPITDFFSKQTQTRTRYKPPH
jgi:transformation/transcription domain-associated protein